MTILIPLAIQIALTVWLGHLALTGRYPWEAKPPTLREIIDR